MNFLYEFFIYELYELYKFFIYQIDRPSITKFYMKIHIHLLNNKSYEFYMKKIYIYMKLKH